VIDASVALKWILRDEEATLQADALLDDLLAGRLSLFAPTIFDYEITNALKVAVIQERLSASEAELALDKFRLYLIERVDFLPLQNVTFELALKYQRSAYDSAYLALASSLKLWFYTGDKRLFNTVSTRLDWVKWIGDYNFEVIPQIDSSTEHFESQ
jgi:predicted nucleic acid-binding protein